MSPRPRISLSSAATAFLMCGATAAPLADVSTFQQGVNGYTGCRSLLISDQGGIGPPGQYNDNGFIFADGSNDWLVGQMYGSLGSAYFVLLRFDDLGIPAGAGVLSASLTLTLTAYDAGGRLSGRFLARPWNATYTAPLTGTNLGPVGWRYADKPVAWSALAALGEGTDLRPGTPFLIPAGGPLAPGSEQVVTIPLDVPAIRSWITNPSNNFGIRLQGANNDVATYFAQPQRTGLATRHPKLTIEWSTTLPVVYPVPPPELRFEAVPNPFRDQTELQFTVTEEAEVRLVVTDLQGRAVARLANGTFPAGPHTASLDTSGLAPGVYLAVLDRGGDRRVRRIVCVH